MKIFIDAGHNYKGADTEACANDLREQDINFYIAKKLGSLLSLLGVEVCYSRNALTDCVGTTENTSIIWRYTRANKWGAHFFISIHCNSNPSVNCKGTESLVYGLGGVAEQLADAIGNEISGNLSINNRGTKVRTDLGVLRETTMPAVLVETAFLSNYNESQLLVSRQDDFAYAIYEAIKSVLGLKEVNKVDEQSEHWAKKYLTFLKDKEIDIQEERFDDTITRGEVFKIIALSLGYKEE